MMNRSGGILLLFFILSVVHEGSFYTHYVKLSKRGECKYTGYVPGGKTVEVKRINAPVATLQGNALTAPLKWTGKASMVAMHSMNALKAFGKLSATFAKIAPALGPCLGVFGSVLGGLVDLTKPKPADIMKAVNKAIAKLTDEVNDRMSEMKGYVEKKVIDMEHSLIDREYKTLFLLWSNCIEELTYDETNRCQRDAAKTIIAAKPKFMISAASNDVYNMKRVEATLLSFRDYATLSVMCLKALVDTYKGKTDTSSKLYYNRYNEKLKSEVEGIVSYITKAVDDVVKMHTDNNNPYGHCDKSFTCKGLNEGREGFWLSKVHTYSWRECTCVFDGADVATKTCTSRITIRTDGKGKEAKYTRIQTQASSYSGATTEYAKKQLHESGKPFVEEMKKVIQTYWENEVLCLIPAWQEVANALPSVNDEYYPTHVYNINLDDEPYSPVYHLRLATALKMADEFDSNRHYYDNDDSEALDEMY